MSTTKIIKLPIGNSLIIPCTTNHPDDDFTNCTITSLLKNRSGKGRSVATFNVELGSPIQGKIKTFVLKLNPSQTAQLEIDEIHGFDIKFEYTNGIISNSPIVLVQFTDRVTD